MIERLQPKCDLEVDGGIEHHTARTVVDARANVLVVGTGIFRNPRGPTAAMQDLREVVSRDAE